MYECSCAFFFFTSPTIFFGLYCNILSSSLFIKKGMSTSHFRLPYGYSGAPPWPSLYWPFGPDFEPVNLIADVPHSLYYLQGMCMSCYYFFFIWI